MIFKKNAVITFKCAPELYGVLPNPIPANNCTPKWFRKMNYEHSLSIKTVKKCVPFKDAMDMGYIIPLWVDLNVENDGNKITFGTRNSEALKNGIFGDHNILQIEGSPLRNFHYGSQPMKFMNPWLITTPPGWSCMFIQPINHFDNRFQIITGIVDTDKYINNVNFPFLWNDRNFKGLIAQGTPLVQVIPFRRTEWAHSIEQLSEIDNRIITHIKNKLSLIFKNGYRNLYWVPKKYR